MKPKQEKSIYDPTGFKIPAGVKKSTQFIVKILFIQL